MPYFSAHLTGTQRSIRSSIPSLTQRATIPLAFDALLRKQHFHKLLYRGHGEGEAPAEPYSEASAQQELRPPALPTFDGLGTLFDFPTIHPMPSRSLFQHPSAAERLKAARDWLLALPKEEEVVVVAPTHEAGQELLRQVALIQSAGFGWHRITVSRLANELAAYDLAAEEKVPIGTLACEAVVARVVHGLSESGKLGRYAAIAHSPGFAGTVGRALQEVECADVSRSELEIVSLELRQLAEAYDAALSKAKLVDRAAVLETAISACQHMSEHPLLGCPTLLLDLAIDSVRERRLIQHVVKRSDNVLATCVYGDSRSVEHLTQALSIEPSTQDSADSLDNLQRLQRRLFEPLASRDPEQLHPSDESVNVISAAGESRECVEIARAIINFSQQGYQFDRMAVLLRSPDEYRAFLEEAFHRAKVPAHFSQGVVRPDAAGRAFVALLRCAAERLSARRFAEYLSLGEIPQATDAGEPQKPPPEEERWETPEEEFFPSKLLDEAEAELFEDEEQESIPGAETGSTEATEDAPFNVPSNYTAPVYHGSLRAPRRWEQLIVDAAVIGGRNRWQRRLTGLAHQLQLDLEALDDPDDPKAERIQVQIDDLQALQTFALPILVDLDALPNAATWGEWIDRLTALASRSLRQPARVLAMMSELAPMAPIGPIGLEEVTRVLSRHLLQLRIRPEERRDGSIFVGPIEAGRGHTFDVVFIPGIAERLFPRKIAEDSLLNDVHRKKLDASLPCNPDRVEAERTALRLAVSAAKEKVILSYPRIDSEKGRQRVPSFYALEAIRAAEGRLPMFQELAERARTQDATRVGWPAPADPNQAIDDAEYDLALLDALLDKTPEETVGTAHYLLSANPHLARALRFRARRWLRRWTKADGFVEPSPAAVEAIAKHAMSERSFSPTALQTYADCPYKFFLYAIQRLAPRDEVDAIEEMTPLQRGSLIHEIQFRLLSQLQSDGNLPVTTDNLKTALEQLDQEIQSVAATYYDDLAPAIERVWRDGIATVRSDLREWLRRMSIDESGFVPWRFELSFGLPKHRMHDANSVVEAVELACGVRLRGSIDLVEQKRPDRVRVTDHKTGRRTVAKGSVVEGGSSLQAVLYGLVAEQLFADSLVESGRLYYCTAGGSFEDRPVQLDEQAREAADQVVKTIANALSEGFLPAAPKEGACRWCDYQTICGVNEERRVLRKPPAETRPLIQLRKLP